MNSWRAILAAIVIFGAGAMTGGLLVNHADQSPTPDNPPHQPGPSVPPGLDRSRQLIHLLDTKLSDKLTPDQKSKIEKIISDGQAQISECWKTNRMSEIVKEINQQVDQQIRGQLTPDQQKQFEDLLKHPPHRPNSTNAPATNSPAGTNSPTKAPNRTSNRTPDKK